MKSRSTIDRCNSYYVITIIDISVIKATRRVEGIIGTITRRVFAMSWREATLKTSYDTSGQTQWCSLRGPRLFRSKTKSSRPSIQRFPFFSPREKKKENLSLERTQKLSKLKRINVHDGTTNDGAREKRRKIERLSTLLAGLSAWPSCTPCMHTVGWFPCAGWFVADSRAWPCLNTPAGSARRATALQYLLHMPGSVRLREGACIGGKRRSEVARRDLSSSRISGADRPFLAS